MCGDYIPTKLIKAEVQQNGIIRLEHPGHEKHGYLLARLEPDVTYESLPDITPTRSFVKAFKTFEEIRKDHPETAAALDRMLEENPNVKDQLFLFQNQNLFVIDPSKIEKSTTEGEIVFKHTRGGFPVKDTNEDIDQELLVYINSTPELLSLLWDIGLLPEQTMSVLHLWLRTVVVTKLFQRVKELEVAIGKGEKGSAYSLSRVEFDI